MIPPGLQPDDMQPGASVPGYRLVRAGGRGDVADDLKDFLTRSDGYNGPVGEGYLVLWGVRDLVSGITGYEVGDDMSDVFYIGSNGGPTAYGRGPEQRRPVYVSVPFVPSRRAEIRVLGGDLTAFVDAVAAGEGW